MPVPDPSESTTGSEEKPHIHAFVRGAGTTAGATIQHHGSRRKANAQQRLKIATPASRRPKRKVRM